jgi:hypothetical protein
MKPLSELEVSQRRYHFLRISNGLFHEMCDSRQPDLFVEEADLSPEGIGQLNESSEPIPALLGISPGECETLAVDEMTNRIDEHRAESDRLMLSLLEFEPIPNNHVPVFTVDPVRQARFERLHQALRTASESSNHVPVFEIGIEREDYQDYARENSVGECLSSDYANL